MAPLRYAAKCDPFLSLDCAPTPSTLAQCKERKGSNFAIWQPWVQDRLRGECQRVGEAVLPLPRSPHLRGCRVDEPTPCRPRRKLGGDEREVLLADEDGQREEATERQRVRLSKRGERMGAVSLQGVPND